jgi:uncharacterized protein affecting Mg2+/Co2+ transport
VTESVVICPDLTGDGVIGTADLIALNQQFTCTSNCTGDFNQDGIVDVADFMILLAYFGQFCN